MRLPTFLFLLLPLLAGATAPPAHPYADATRRRIATAQDERNTTILRPFLTDKNATYRAAAALAFGSVQDKAAIPTLLPLLTDKSPAVRRAAAFALGQAGDSLAVPALTARLGQFEPSASARRAAYEALGRCVSRRLVAAIWQAPAAGPDSAAANGRAWALYRAALRGLSTTEVVGQAAALLARPGPALAPARAGAAAALARVRGQDSALARVARPALLKGLATDPSYYVRVNCAAALGRVITRPGVLGALLSATTDADFRVRVAALRALPALDNEQVLRVVERSLQQPQSQESLTAAEWLLRAPVDSSHWPTSVHKDYLPSSWATFALPPYERKLSWRVRATWLQALLRHTPPAGRLVLADTIRRRYQHTPNQYEKAALLTALSEDPAQFDFLSQEATRAGGPPVVPGAALAALVALRENKRFPADRQADFTAMLRRALAGGDVAQLGTAAEALANPALVPAPGPDDLAALRQAQARLTLPREVEAWLGIQQALDKLTKAPKPTPAPAVPKQPIDWAVVQSVPVGQRVRITTGKGAIVLVLKVEEAPGSVASFVSLVRQHFYDGLYFHRVVPDFVAQGGDPRGDGSGSTPSTLRSEFSFLTYGTGAVGLASAGKDTESCQFFFTHLPTPHLDGRYTIFAQVAEGQEVVQQLEIGDKMLRVELL